jgi:hypothetical protein
MESAMPLLEPSEMTGASSRSQPIDNAQILKQLTRAVVKGIRRGGR